MASTIRRFAEEPELTCTAYRLPIQAANSASKARTRSPMVSLPESRTALAAAISSGPMVSAAKRYGGLLGTSHRQRRLVRAELRALPLGVRGVQYRLEPRDGLRGRAGGLTPDLCPGSAGSLCPAGARGPGKHRLPRDPPLRAA